MSEQINIDASNGDGLPVEIEVPNSAMLATLNRYTVANLPTGTTAGQVAFAINGRDVGEGVGAGTGVPVYYKNGGWHVFYANAVVSS